MNPAELVKQHIGLFIKEIFMDPAELVENT